MKKNFAVAAWRQKARAMRAIEKIVSAAESGRISGETAAAARRVVEPGGVGGGWGVRAWRRAAQRLEAMLADAEPAT